MHEIWTKGLRVRISDNALHPEFRGLEGTVFRYVKCNDEVVITLDTPVGGYKRYYAFPGNVETL